jgi:hypothetical protein
MLPYLFLTPPLILKKKNIGIFHVVGEDRQNRLNLIRFHGYNYQIVIMIPRNGINDYGIEGRFRNDRFASPHIGASEFNPSPFQIGFFVFSHQNRNVFAGQGKLPRIRAPNRACSENQYFHCYSY